MEAVAGALSLLGEDENWEQFGDMTPEECAQIMRDMLFRWYNDPCDMIPAPYWDDIDAEDANDEAAPDDQPWYGVWDGETFIESLSYWAVTAFLATGIGEGSAIEFITPLRTFRLTLKRDPHGAKLLVFMNSNLFQLIDLFSPTEDVVTVDVVSEDGGTLMLVQSDEHNPLATPDANGNYTVQVIRKRLSEEEVDAITDIRQQAGSGQLQLTRGTSGVWEDVPTADNVRVDGTVAMTGDLDVVISSTANAGPQLAAIKNYRRGGTNPAAGYGIDLEYWANPTYAGADVRMARDIAQFGATGTLWTALRRFLVADSVQERTGIRLFADGSATGIGFLGAVGAVRQVITGERDGNPALAALLTAMANFGLITDSTTVGTHPLMDARQNTEAPCALEYSRDGAAWTAFADLSLCPPDPITYIYDIDLDIILQCGEGGCFEQPLGDPRHADIYRYPPNVTAQTKCDAAASMVRFISDTVNETTYTVSVGTNAVAFVSLLTGLIGVLGPFGVFVSLMLDIFTLITDFGATVVSGAFTNEVYDVLLCIFYCHVDENGQLDAAALADINSGIDTQIGGTAATVLHAFLLLKGEVGLSNAGALGLDTDDCSACECGCAGPGYFWVFTAFGGGWTPASGWVASADSVWVSGLGWTARIAYYEGYGYAGYPAVWIEKDIDGFSAGEITLGWYQALAATSILIQIVRRSDSTMLFEVNPGYGFGVGTHTQTLVFDITGEDVTIRIGVHCDSEYEGAENGENLTQLKSVRIC